MSHTAISFDSMILCRLTGLVNSKDNVCVRFSSENVRIPIAGIRNINKYGARAKKGVNSAYPLSGILKLPGIIQSRHPLIMRKSKMKISPDNEYNKDLSSFNSIHIIYFQSGTKVMKFSFPFIFFISFIFYYLCSKLKLIRYS